MEEAQKHHLKIELRPLKPLLRNAFQVLKIIAQLSQLLHPNYQTLLCMQLWFLAVHSRHNHLPFDLCLASADCR